MKSNISRLPKFIPQRLLEAREARGLTIIELSEQIGVSHQMISKYEKGRSVPSHEILQKISSVLRLPLKYFLKPYKSSSKESVVFFRGKAAATVKSKKVHQSRISWLEEIHKYLEEIIDFPEVDIPVFNTSEKFIPTDLEMVDEIAINVRKHWGLGNGPISNVVLLLEKKGVIISRGTFPDFRLDACSKWEEQERPYVILSNDKSAVRSRFDIAHELGHLVLHPRVSWSEFNKKDNYKRIEKEADRFASAFLLPETSFGQEVFSVSFDHLINLKERWKVSIGAIAYRARILDILNENQYIYIRQKMAKQNWFKNEPLDDVIKFEEPQALKQAFELIIEHNVKKREEVVYDIGLDREEIEIMSNLNYGYLIDRPEPLSNIIQFKK